MAVKNKLSIYLIRDEFSSDDSFILKNSRYQSIEINKDSKVYFEQSKNSIPRWMKSFFCGSLDNASIFVSNARAVLVSRINTGEMEYKAFAVTLGYGKNMLKDGVIEEDFGLKVVLNTISSNSIRRIHKMNIGGNRKISNEQLPLESDIDDFGFDIDRDLISIISGRSDDESFVTGLMTGSDMLNLNAEVDVSNLDQFLLKVYLRYKSDAYKKEFSWIDQIRRVKDKKCTDMLDSKVMQMIHENSPKVWMAVPEVIEWEYIAGFKYAGRELLDDIVLDSVVGSFKGELVNIEQLKAKRISAIREDNGEIYRSWHAYKCIYAELELNGSEYCLNNGNWFCVNKDFVNMIEDEYKKIPISSRLFLPYENMFNRESDYSKAFVKSDPDHLLYMDTKLIGHGGGNNKIELCDVLAVNGEYIHIKPYAGSATLSHLFNQAVVSAELIMGDAEFLAKANLEINKQTTKASFMINRDVKPTVVLAIISKYNMDRPPIPFFSKIAIRYAVRRLNAYGCKVYIKNIFKKQ